MLASSQEQLLFETRRHGIVLAGAFVKAGALSLAGVACLGLGGRWAIAAAVALSVAAFLALRAVTAWESTRLRVTDQKLAISTGILRRRSASVRLAQTGPVEVEQTLPGRLFGYGTVIAGDLEIDYIPDPDEVFEVLGQVD
jgi:uncharacterized membrane protein YdbT with pleckstrin-like domain